jgi:hypothetical protein
MAKYICEAKAPMGDGDGGLLRPLDVREFTADPGAPWRLLPDDEEAEKPVEPDEPPPGPKVSLPAATTLTGATAPPKPAGTTED